MQGGASALAGLWRQTGTQPDLLLATDMLHLPAFLGLVRQRASRLPVALYFHENQITYPWSPKDQDPGLGRDKQYGYINFLSALVADTVFFNSSYHRDSFLEALPQFLRQFPDRRGLHHLESLKEKCEVLPLGLNLKGLELPSLPKQHPEATLLWNHRWEYDKNPEAFFRLLLRLKKEGVAFKLIVLGDVFRSSPPIFQAAKEKLRDEILHWGYAPNREAYTRLLWRADILPVTSHQDFFGGSVVEAMYCRCFPLLPKRLAYPEHIPEGHHHRYFYDSEENLYQRLRQTIHQLSRIRKSTVCQDFVKKYDWSNLAPQYDSRLACVSQKQHQK